MQKEGEGSERNRDGKEGGRREFEAVEVKNYSVQVNTVSKDNNKSVEGKRSSHNQILLVQNQL